MSTLVRFVALKVRKKQLVTLLLSAAPVSVCSGSPSLSQSNSLAACSTPHPVQKADNQWLVAFLLLVTLRRWNCGRAPD